MAEDGGGASDGAENFEDDVVHYRVECDGCDMFPLVGPRFKSRQKSNHELCLRCFEGDGIDPNDYVRFSNSTTKDGKINSGPSGEQQPQSDSEDLQQAVSGVSQLGKEIDGNGKSAATKTDGVNTNNYPNIFLSSTTHDVKIDSPVGEQQSLSGSKDLQKADHGLVQPGKEVDINASSGAGTTDKGKCPAGTSGATENVREGAIHYHTCDGCEMVLVGPRFKSCKKLDYDLCLSCFEADGVDPNDYVKIEQPIEVLAAEKLKKVLTNVKIWLAGCSSAEDAIQGHLANLEIGIQWHLFGDGGTATQIVFGEVVHNLIECLTLYSYELMCHANSLEDALRVEVVVELLWPSLISLLPNSSEALFDRLAHLERLTQDHDYFNQTIAGYGYAGITLTKKGSLHIVPTELITSGKLFLQKVSLLEPFLLDLTRQDVSKRMWFCSHYELLSKCFWNLEMYEGSMPWQEAALRVVTFDLKYQAAVSNGNQHSESESATGDTARDEMRLLGAKMHFSLGTRYASILRYEEAAKHSYLSAQLQDDQAEREAAQAQGGRALDRLSVSGEVARALEVTKQLLSQTSTYSDSPMLRASILQFKGKYEMEIRDFDSCIHSFEEARKIYEEENLLEHQDLGYNYLFLIKAYMSKHEHRAAFWLLESFQPTMDKYHRGTQLWQSWQAHKAVHYIQAGDLQNAEQNADKAWESLKLPAQMAAPDSQSRENANYLQVLVKECLYTVHNYGFDDCRKAIAKREREKLLDQKEKLINEEGCGPDLSLSKKLALAEIHQERTIRRLFSEGLGTLGKGEVAIADLTRANNILQEGILLLRGEVGQKHKLVGALACQANVLNELLARLSGKVLNHPSSEVSKLLDEAMQLVQTGGNPVQLARFKFFKASLVASYNLDLVTAEVEIRDGLIILTEVQLKLKDREAFWVSLFGHEMILNFNLMQLLLLMKQEAPKKALLWAERGRMRLFVYLTKERGDEDFFNVEHPALQNLKLNQGPEPQKVLEQVSSSEEESLKESSGPRCSGPVHQITPGKWTEAVEGNYDNVGDLEKSGGLDELWFDKDDTLAEKYLFQGVEECGPGALILEYTFAEDIKTLIIYVVFVDSGDRSVVVEWKNVSILQANLEGKLDKKWRKCTTLTSLINTTLGFINKNKDKEAMEGLGLLHSFLIEPVQNHVNCCQRLILAVHEQLALVPFAALYNIHSKKFLVQEKVISYIPSIRVLRYCFYRQRVFEQNLEKGLLGDPFIAGNPEPMGWQMKPLPGAAEEAKLVAQILGVEPYIGPDMTKKAVIDGLSNGSIVLLATHGVVDRNDAPHGALVLQDSSLTDESSSSNGNVGKTADAAIMSEDLASLPTGIRAGLVVLSACKSADGVVTKEGVLGLGRSLLQGGAPTAILALWDVSDSGTRDLVAGVFKQLVTEGKYAAEALQATMVEMMKDETNGKNKYSILHWAPLVVLGSPFFKHKQGPPHSV